MSKNSLLFAVAVIVLMVSAVVVGYYAKECSCESTQGEVSLGATWGRITWVQDVPSGQVWQLAEEMTIEIGSNSPQGSRYLPCPRSGTDTNMSGLCYYDSTAK